jgi:hypothetical protein
LVPEEVVVDKNLRPISPVKLSSSVTPSQSLGFMPTFRMIEIHRLIVDGRYQRDAKRGKSLIIKIVKDFSWSRFQPITVAKVGDHYAVIDGQHRAIAAATHPSIASVPCWVVPQDEIEHQAKTFVGINKTRMAITSTQIYFAGLAANDPDALRIRQICNRANISVARYSTAVARKADHTNAVSSIDALLRKFGDRPVLKALQALREAYPLKTGQLSALNIEALSVFFANFGEHTTFDHARFISRLRDLSLQDVLDGARQQRRLYNGSIVSHMVAALRQTYNDGLKINRLPKSNVSRRAA